MKNNYKIKVKIGRLYKKIKNLKDYFFSGRYYETYKPYLGKKKIMLMLTPDHGNLGDHAIAYASYKYFEENFYGYEIIEFTLDEVYKYAKSIKRIIEKDDIIFTIGGGNMGNTYYEEHVRRFIIKYFKNNKIISLPQTIHFNNKGNSKREYKKTKKIYNAHKNLTVVAREKISFEIMKDTFKNNKVILNPDMVFYLETQCKTKVREKITICLREDIESYISCEERSKIINNVKNNYLNVEICDTVIDKNISKKERLYELNEIWRKFSNSKVVITDRLHGMIFCFITNTPCIVIRNSDHKIIGSYEWIKDVKHIKLIDEYSDYKLRENINSLLNLDTIKKIDFKKDYFKFTSDSI